VISKVIRIDSIPVWRDYARLTLQRVVATNGCFDILHRGHVEYLAKAKRHGDLLIVGVNSDRAVRELKGDGRPINSQEDRAHVVAGLDVVDIVVIFDSMRADEFLRAAKPDVWAKGGDYTIDTLDKGEVEAVLDNKGVIEIIPLSQGYSTTSTLERAVR
jgi:rfaE bifunctional protein nucleotidyltransferase chain/domain